MAPFVVSFFHAFFSFRTVCNHAAAGGGTRTLTKKGLRLIGMERPGCEETGCKGKCDGEAETRRLGWDVRGMERPGCEETGYTGKCDGEAERRRAGWEASGMERPRRGGQDGK